MERQESLGSMNDSFGVESGGVVVEVGGWIRRVGGALSHNQHSVAARAEIANHKVTESHGLQKMEVSHAGAHISPQRTHPQIHPLVIINKASRVGCS